MRTLLFVVLCMTSLMAPAQFLKIDNSIVMSAYSNDQDLPILDSRVTNYAISVGLDYLVRDWFSLSSQIGYMRLEAEQEVDIAPPEFGEITEQQAFIHLNTTFRPHLQKEDVSFFVGIGPTIDILAGDQGANNSFFNGYTYNNVTFGFKAEVGVVQTTEKLRFGVVGGYLRGFTPTLETDAISLFNDSFTAAITIGYRLQ